VRYDGLYLWNAWDEKNTKARDNSGHVGVDRSILKPCFRNNVKTWTAII
jgi:hypothetical protein